MTSTLGEEQMPKLVQSKWLHHPYARLFSYLVIMSLVMIAILVVRDKTSILDNEKIYQEGVLKQLVVIDSQLKTLPLQLNDNEELRSAIITAFGSESGFEIQPQSAGFSIKITTIEYSKFLRAVSQIQQQGVQVSELVMEKGQHPMHVGILVVFQLLSEKSGK